MDHMRSRAGTTCESVTLCHIHTHTDTQPVTPTDPHPRHPITPTQTLSHTPPDNHTPRHTVRPPQPCMTKSGFIHLMLHGEEPPDPGTDLVPLGHGASSLAPDAGTPQAMPCWDPRQPPRGWSYQGSAPTPPGLGCSPLPLGNLLPGPGAGLGRSHSPPPASSLACGGRDRARGAAQPSLSLDSPQRSGRILVPMDGPGWTAPPNASVPPPNETGCGERADFQYVLFPVVYSLVFVLGLAGNGSVLWYFLRTRTATAPANVFLANLAALDLLFVLTLPFRAGYHALRNDWPFGEATCKLTGSLFYANLYGSSLFLSCICLERYVAVVHPLRTVLVVLAVFLICFAPYHLTQVVHTLGRVGALQGCRLLRGTYVARRVTMALTSLNACLDPLVYYCAAERFAWSPPCRAGCCTGRPASSGDTQGTGLRALDNGASRGAQAVTGTSSHDKA
ncbi:uncharacterized protein LOC123361589 isoform X2 [Mauremys mutica]|uniref:uncharacterized protein LOC123361589 isoform X2 n=1 Tax=Mauremys mutica TaxID=74926 RepID=UPI001D13760A|nr:uncharacterized protein LOC123361589 isoform X2 [Mauremys mutica]